MSRGSLTPIARVWAFSACLAAAGGGLFLTIVRDLDPPDPPFQIPFLVLAVLFFLGEIAVVHLHLRSQVYTWSLTEVPMVLGLFFVRPSLLVAAHLVGSALALLMHRRQKAHKFAFNIANFLLTTSVMTIVYVSFVGDDPVAPRGWVATLSATLAASLIATVTIFIAISLADGRLRKLRFLDTGNVATAANTTLALSAATIMWVRLEAAWLLVFPLSLVYFSYRGYTTQRHKHDVLERLYESTQVLQRSLGEQSVVKELLIQARQMLQGEVAEIVILPNRGEDQGFRFQLGPGDVEATERLRLDPTEGVWARVASEDQGLLILPPIKNKRLLRYFDGLGIRNAIVAPLRREDEMIGTLLVGNRLGDVGAFDDQDLKLLETLASHASMSLEKGRLVESLQQQAAENEYLAQHDSLTGLINRMSFRQRVHDEISTGSGSEAGVVLIDLDRFKEINDTLGHQVGDRVLLEVAKRIRMALPEGATVARFGGDEFAVFLPGVSGTAEAADQAEAIGRVVSKPLKIDDYTLEIDASVGLAMYPKHGRDADLLMQRADVAMYIAKDSRRDLEVYGVDKDQYSPARLSLVGELRKGIELKELVLFYQPKVDLRDDEVVGVEALVRWQHPRKGIVPPNDFIPLDEHTGLIKPLTDYVLRAAVRQCQEWRKTYPTFHVAVNLSARSLADESFCDDVRGILEEFDADPSSLQLEITESMIMHDPARAIEVLTRLNEMGIGLAIDDFGTGYSSLAYLKRLPVHDLKIDRSFVMGMESDENDAIIVRSVIDLGRNLGLRVVAEGIETPEVSTALTAMGCDLGQGYHISRPIPGDKLRSWMTAHTAVSRRPGSLPPSIGAVGGL
ncbi:MAG: putative bifunctional diguanylate cyclase/phosphodiesterase [Actinomycetota bacterium]